MIQYLLYFLLFVLPFLVNPFGGPFFEAPKVILAEVVIEILLVYTLLRHKFKLNQKFVLLIGGLFVLSLADLLVFPSQTAFFGNQFRLQGTFLFWHLIILSLIASQFNVTSNRHWSDKFFLLPLPALLLVTFIFGAESNGRAIGSLGEPNALASTSVFFWPFVWFIHLPKKWQIWVRAGSLMITLIIIFLSGSRSGLMAFLIQLVFLTGLRWIKSKKLVYFSVGFLFLIALFLPLIDQNTGYGFENRVEVWRVATLAGFKSPIIGSGFGNIEQVFKPEASGLKSILQYQYVDSGHNLFLDYWIEGGLVGLAILIFLLVQTKINFMRQHQIKELTLLIGLLVVLLFNPASVASLVAFWWLIGYSFKSAI